MFVGRTVENIFNISM